MPLQALLRHDYHFLVEWGSVFHLFLPVAILGVIYAPSNLRWGLKNPPVELCAAGIVYWKAPFWHPILVP